MALLFVILLHLLGFLAMGIGIALNSVVGAFGRRTRKVADHAVIAHFLGRAGAISGIGGFVLVTSGVGLVMLTRGPTGFGAPWVSVGFTVWLVALITALAVNRPQANGHAADVAAAVAAGQTESDALPQRFAPGLFFAISRVQEIGFVVGLLAMVFKPGA